ncbi:MAG: type 11 methyltransferase [Hyphomicrobiales bacterium]|nr:type 11 methyltransferase [Hyphomicrobiales bacterium]
MTEMDKSFTGSIPALYEKYLVPLFFAPYAADLALRVADLTHGRLLEEAAGSGAVTRALARTLPDSVEIVATDLNQPMLDLAKSTLQGRSIVWRQADACALPFEDNAFDVIVCQFGVMFFPDKLKAFRESRRVLKPSGMFLFNVWDGIGENDFAFVVNETMADLFPQDPPRFFARVPHAYHDTGEIKATLAAGGFDRVEVEAVERRSRAASPLDAAIGLCQGTPLRNEIESRDPERLEEATVTTAAALSARFGAGAIEGKMRALVVTATR